jgi:hypothetical protein
LAECHEAASADLVVELELAAVALDDHADALLGANPGIGLEHPVGGRERDAVE